MWSAVLTTSILHITVFDESKDFLEGAAGSVQSLRALVKLKQELEEVCKVGLLVPSLLAVLSFQLTSPFVSN